MIIDPQSLIAWKKHAPWADEWQIEQDLIIARMLVAIFSHRLLQTELAFRGGTALQKCFFHQPTRYSEDVDLVQIKKGAIGAISNALHDTLNPWLGQPTVKRWAGRFSLIYRFTSSNQNKPMRLKIEINTQENYSFLALIEKPFVVDTDWFAGRAMIKTYQTDELMATKLRALFQRRKGRDLFDMARAIELLPINIEKILGCFASYLERENTKVTRAEFEKNLMLKKDSIVFREDIIPLLPPNAKHDFDQDFTLVMSKLIAKLPGEQWKGIKD